jgi:predicted nucleic acid-binding protein
MAATRTKALLMETTILVDFLRGSQAAAEYLDRARFEANLVTSNVTAAELIVGARTRAELRALDQLLARFIIEAIHREDSVLALKWLRKFHHHRGIGYHDCLLGAAAVRLRIPLVTSSPAVTRRLSSLARSSLLAMIRRPSRLKATHCP